VAGLITLAFCKTKRKNNFRLKKRKTANTSLSFRVSRVFDYYGDVVKFSSCFGFWGASKKATKSTNVRRSTNWRFFPLSLD